MHTKEVAKNIFIVTFHAPEIAASAHPGQFVELGPLAAESILSRPMAIYDVDQKAGTIKVGFQAIGLNTRKYALLKPGDTLTLTLTAPLGGTHTFDFSFDNFILVSGGIGITSLHLIGKHLAESGKTITTLMGARSKEFISCRQDFAQFGDVHIATDDGSEGHHGYIHELLSNTLSSWSEAIGSRDSISQSSTSFQNDTKKIQVIYCGPHPMMRACAEVCNDNNIAHLAVMEEMMACGFGICVACVCQTTQGQKKVCIDGPIFDGATLTWEAEQTAEGHE